MGSSRALEKIGDYDVVDKKQNEDSGKQNKGKE